MSRIVSGPRLLSCPEDPASYEAMLECPVCYELILPPIIPCINGHNICTRCRSQITNCPICRGPISRSRNIFLESILEQSRFNCKFNSAGCSEGFRGQQLLRHELNCDFRPVYCDCCDKFVRYDKFLKHLIQQRGITIVPVSGFRAAFAVHPDDLASGGRHSTHFAWLKRCGTDFFLHLDNDGEGRDWWIYITVFGLSSKAEEWNCELVLSNEEMKMSFTYNGPVNPIRATGLDAGESGRCIYLTKSALEAYATSDWLEVSVKLFPKHDEHPPNNDISVPSLDNAVQPYSFGPNSQTYYGNNSTASYQNAPRPMLAVVSEIQVQRDDLVHDAGDGSSRPGRVRELRQSFVSDQHRPTWRNFPVNDEIEEDHHHRFWFSPALPTPDYTTYARRALFPDSRNTDRNRAVTPSYSYLFPEYRNTERSHPMNRGPTHLVNPPRYPNPGIFAPPGSVLPPVWPNTLVCQPTPRGGPRM